MYQIKNELGYDFNSALGKYLMGVSFSMALVFIYFTNSELLTSNPILHSGTLLRQGDVV